MPSPSHSSSLKASHKSSSVAPKAPAAAPHSGVLDPPVLLLHGALGAAETLAPLQAALVAMRTEAGIDAAASPVMLHEFAGHGRTPSSSDAPPLSIERMAGEVAARLDADAWHGVDIFGYSMGGYVALHLARTRPELVRRIVTLGTKLAWDPETAERETRLLDPEAIEAKVPRFAGSLAQRHGEPRWRALCAETAALLRGLGERPLLDATAFAEIAQPVCIGVGDRDGTVGFEECMAAFEALPAGAFAVLPATPHPLERTDVDALARLVVSRFTERERGGKGR